MGRNTVSELLIEDDERDIMGTGVDCGRDDDVVSD